MLRVNEYQFYDLAVRVHLVGEVEENEKVQDRFPALFFAREALLDGLQQIPLRICKPVVGELIRAIDSVLPRDDKGAMLPMKSDQTISYLQAYDLRETVKKFEAVLSAELQAFDTYFISQKGAYSTPDLIERADVIFPETIRRDIPQQAIIDIREAGRCFAFDAPTAAGFHILRAIEAVMAEYYAIIIGTAIPTRMRNWGIYIKKMQDSGKADPKIIVFLDHIREQYRNPITHPEVILSSDEVEVLLSTAVGAIRQMILAIQKTPVGLSAPAASTP